MVKWLIAKPNHPLNTRCLKENDESLKWNLKYVLSKFFYKHNHRFILAEEMRTDFKKLTTNDEISDI